MLFRNILLPTLIVPTVGAAAVFALLTWWPREDVARRGRSAMACTLAFLSGFVALSGWPRWPPVEATQRVFLVVAVSAVLAWFVRYEFRSAAVWFVRGVLTGLLLVLTLQTLLENSWTGSQSVLWLGGLFVFGMALHWAWGESLREEGDRSDWIAAVVRIALLSGLAAVLGMSASARLAQLGGALACGVGVVEVGSRVLGRRPWHGGAAPVLTTVVLGLMIVGHFYAELLAWPAALVGLAFLMLGVPTGGRRWTRLLAIVPLALAVGLTVHAMLNEPDDPYADYYSTLHGDGNEIRRAR